MPSLTDIPAPNGQCDLDHNRWIKHISAHPTADGFKLTLTFKPDQLGHIGDAKRNFGTAMNNVNGWSMDFPMRSDPPQRLPYAKDITANESGAELGVVITGTQYGRDTLVFDVQTPTPGLIAKAAITYLPHFVALHDGRDPGPLTPEAMDETYRTIHALGLDDPREQTTPRNVIDAPSAAPQKQLTSMQVIGGWINNF